MTSCFYSLVQLVKCSWDDGGGMIVYFYFFYFFISKHQLLLTTKCYLRKLMSKENSRWLTHWNQQTQMLHEVRVYLDNNSIQHLYAPEKFQSNLQSLHFSTLVWNLNKRIDYPLFTTELCPITKCKPPFYYSNSLQHSNA